MRSSTQDLRPARRTAKAAKAVRTARVAAKRGRYAPMLRQVRSIGAWRYAKGRGVIVAVIDSGTNPRNANLRGRVLRGIDLVEPRRRNGWHDPIRFGGHGTGVASLIVGTGRGNGVFGVAPAARVLPVRVADRHGSSPDRRIARGIRWAVNHGADVINISMGGPDDAPVLRQAVAYAHRKGVVIVAAAGNDGPNNTRPTYPAAYPGVIGVGASAIRASRVAPFSDRGRWVDLVAPGMSVWNTNTDGTLGQANGTSFSAPIVAGTVALMLQANPRLRPAEVGQLLRGTAVDMLTYGRDRHSGAGQLDAFAAVGAASALRKGRGGWLM